LRQTPKQDSPKQIGFTQEKAGFAPFTEAKRQDSWKIMKVTAAEKADVYTGNKKTS
jgi:hypothetical protein